jgi:hypothetical protein
MGQLVYDCVPCVKYVHHTLPYTELRLCRSLWPLVVLRSNPLFAQPSLMMSVYLSDFTHAGPRQYASKICALLVDAGAQPLWVPCIEISAVEEAGQIAQLHQSLEDLSSYTYVAFTSKNGIHAFLHELEVLKGAAAQEFVRQSGVQFCALGADSQVVEAAGYDVHVLPKESSTQGLVRELKARGLLAGSRILCPVPHVTGERSCPGLKIHIVAVGKVQAGIPLSR